MESAIRYLFLTTWAGFTGLFAYLGEPFWVSVCFGLVLNVAVWAVLIVFVAASIFILDALDGMGVFRLPR